MTTSPGATRRRVLFMAEAVTLAHVARPLTLGAMLPTDRYEVTLAADPRYESLYADSPLRRLPLRSISSERFGQALASGRPIYDSRTLLGYVEDDLRLMRDLRPDVVVGDMRLSLAISARQAGVPYIAITNAYWSPHARVTWPIPDMPLARLAGLWLGQRVFDVARPMAFALHTLPMRRARRRHGLSSRGLSLQKVYTEADLTLYADLPGLTPMADPLPDGHRFLGPVLWEPHGQLPDWWNSLPADRPILYANLGSSGAGKLLPRVLAALADLPVTAIAATAGKPLSTPPPANARIAPFLPGTQACQKADLVICNGGSPATQQAIAAGKPMLCLPGNLDQFLNTQGLLRVGAARQVRADQASPATLRATIMAMLDDHTHTAEARKLQQQHQRWNASSHWLDLLQSLLPSPGRA